MVRHSQRGIPLSVMEEYLLKAGAERVSKSAKTALKELLERRAKVIASNATSFATHAGRRTVMKKDVALVRRPNA